jgi:hypothetical protein
MSLESRVEDVEKCAVLVRNDGVMTKQLEADVLRLETELFTLEESVVDEGVAFEDAIRGCDKLNAEGDIFYIKLCLFF